MCSKRMVLAVWIAFLMPAFASKPMTVQQFEEAVTTANASHLSDDALAQQLANVRLTARLTGDSLQKLIAISPGTKFTQTLYAIAGLSSFLAPPADELPSTPAPSLAAQKAIMGRTVNYVVHTLPSLPNFLATRLTRQYVDNMRGVDLVREYRGELYWIGDHHAPIAFRDGRESDDPILMASLSSQKKNHSGADSASQQVVNGMTSWGEFGPILGVVLLDAAKGKLNWERWQTQDGKPVAVFQFSVDQAASNYQLNYCCVVSREFNDPVSALNTGLQKITIKPGYHGSFEIDPETGNILRITIEADLQPDDTISRALMMVEYGPMKIGDDLRFCPVRSVSVSESRRKYESHGTIVSEDRRFLNEVEFTGYHRFGSESTLIVASADSKSASAAAAQSEADSSPAPAAADAAESATANTSSEAAPAALPSPSPVAPAPAVDAEIAVQPATALPGMDTGSPDSAHAGSSSSGAFTLKVTTRLVAIGLVATDKHNKPITDLKSEEIELYDNGRRQQIAAFNRAPAAAPAAASQPPDTFTNQAMQVGRDASDLFILLIDESHLPFNDLNRARGEVLRFLKSSRPDARLALYSIGEHGFRAIQNMTTDHSVVEAKLAAWMPSAAAISQAGALDQRNRQQIDEVRNLSDFATVNGNQAPAADGITSVDPNLRLLGDDPLGRVLNSMISLAGHFAAVPGHKTLAWISGDSALLDWRDQAVGLDSKTDNTETAINLTREALNEAHISLYAIDASMFSVGGAAVDPSLYSRNVELNPTAAANSAPGGAGSNRINQAGRATEQMQNDTRGIQGPVRLLAESTGGRAVNKGSDIKATLDSIANESAALYDLGFDPDTPADGKFHTLLVKIPTRKDVKLRYRTGYLYNEDSGNTQQRFQAAVWSPQDATGIALTAEAASNSGIPAVKLRITFPGLGLEKTEGKDPRWQDQLYIFVAQRDDATQKAEISGDTLRLSLKQATYDSGMPAGIPYSRDIDIKSKLGSVRIIVVDGNSGKMGSVTLPSSALRP